jgi:HEAT repeat protein
MQSAALLHPKPKVRREALAVLDHAANDESTSTFRPALSDPVPRVRIVALHGLGCERCRMGEICVDDVVPDVLRVVREDSSPKVRHAAIDVLVRFMSRDGRIGEALREVAAADNDEFVSLAAKGAAGLEHHVWTRKAVRRRDRARSHRTDDRGRATSPTQSGHPNNAS